MTVLAWVAPVLALTKEERLLLWASVLLVVIIGGALFIGRVERWRNRQMQDANDAPEQLGNFREMFENGELSKEEYDRVMRRMAERVGIKPKPKPVPAAAQEPVPEPPANQEPPNPLNG